MNILNVFKKNKNKSKKDIYQAVIRGGELISIQEVTHSLVVSYNGLVDRYEDLEQQVKVLRAAARENERELITAYTTLNDIKGVIRDKLGYDCI